MKTRWAILLIFTVFMGCNSWTAAKYYTINKYTPELLAEIDAGFAFGKISAEIEYDHKTRKLVNLIKDERDYYKSMAEAMAGVGL